MLEFNPNLEKTTIKAIRTGVITQWHQENHETSSRNLSQLLNVSVDVMQHYYNKDAQFDSLKKMNEELNQEKSFLALTNDNVDANATNFSECEATESNLLEEANKGTIIGELHSLCKKFAQFRSPEEFTRTIRTTVNNKEWSEIVESEAFKKITPIVPRHIQEFQARKNAGLVTDPSTLLSSSNTVPPQSKDKSSPRVHTPRKKQSSGKATAGKKPSPKETLRNSSKKSTNSPKPLPSPRPIRKNVCRTLNYADSESDSYSESDFDIETSAPATVSQIPNDDSDGGSDFEVNEIETSGDNSGEENQRSRRKVFLNLN